jgi:hypothetical protein
MLEPRGAAKKEFDESSVGLAPILGRGVHLPFND